MRNGLAWLTLGIGWVLFGTSSCGKDEATGGSTPYCQLCEHSSECASGNVCRVVGDGVGRCAKASENQCCEGSSKCHDLQGSIESTGGSAGMSSSGGSGGGILGGSGGKGGTGGSGGKGGSGGTGGTGVTPKSNLGRACVKDADCADATLSCVTNSGLADGSGPAKGICTASCTTNSQCLEIADNSYCYPFTNDEMFCVEGCATGALGVPKCHEREEVACSLIGLIPRGTACASTDDCQTGELCDNQTSECGAIVTGCTPICGGDYDCGDGQKCDFSSGLCVSGTPAGLPLGSFCDPSAATDPCNGFCLAGDKADEGECSALCTLTPALTGCGWDGTGPADTACLFATILSGSDVAPGDVGICGSLCDCNAECPISTDRCIDESGGTIMQIWGRSGYCRALQMGETQADTFQTCPPGSTGGTGGKGGAGGKGGSGGMSGEAGQSGAGSGGQGGA